MRNAFIVATIVGLGAAPANAAQIIQVDTYSSHPFFQTFDAALGTLNAVKLDIDIVSNRMLYVTGPLPQGVPAQVPVDWAINGFANAYLPLLGGHGTTLNLIPITGSGSGVADAPGPVFTRATGAGSFDIALDAVRPVANGSGIFFNVTIPGLYDYTVDTSFSSPYPVNIFGPYNQCASGFGSETCNGIQYTLTYDYSPVPEPMTWVMMLTGFGAIGMAMRRRRYRVMLSCAG